MFAKKALFLTTLLLIAITSNVWGKNIYVEQPVTRQSIGAAIKTASSGDTVLVPNGTHYNIGMFTINTNNITFRAETPGGVVFKGDYSNYGNCLINITGDNITVRDFIFDSITNNGGGVKVILVDGTKGVRITNNHFQNITTAKDSWVVWAGRTSGNSNFEISNNTFEAVNAKGIVIFPNTPNSYVHHNLFLNFLGGNFNSAMQIGRDTSTSSDMYTVVEYNYFENMIADNETISNKGSSNYYRFNVFKKSNGIVLRGGDDCVVDSNYFLDTGNNKSNNTIRIHDSGHTVINNYIEGATGDSAILVSGTNSNHSQVENISILNNTILDSATYGIWIGFAASKTASPKNLYFEGNMIRQSKGYMVSNSGYEGDFKWLRNSFQGTAKLWRNMGGGDQPASGIQKVDVFNSSISTEIPVSKSAAGAKWDQAMIVPGAPTTPEPPSGLRIEL